MSISYYLYFIAIKLNFHLTGNITTQYLYKCPKIYFTDLFHVKFLLKQITIYTILSMKKYIVNFHNKYKRRDVICTVVLLYDNLNVLQLKYITRAKKKRARYINCTSSTA